MEPTEDSTEENKGQCPQDDFVLPMCPRLDTQADPAGTPVTDDRSVAHHSSEEQGSFEHDVPADTVSPAETETVSAVLDAATDATERVPANIEPSIEPPDMTVLSEVISLVRPLVQVSVRDPQLPLQDDLRQIELSELGETIAAGAEAEAEAECSGAASSTGQADKRTSRPGLFDRLRWTLARTSDQAAQHTRSLSSPELLADLAAAPIASPNDSNPGLGIHVRNMYTSTDADALEAGVSSTVPAGDEPNSSYTGPGQTRSDSIRRYLFGRDPDKPEEKQELDPEDIDELCRSLNAPPNFFCPISMELMRQPTLITSGQTFEFQSINNWVKTCQGELTCPVTRQTLGQPPVLIQNLALRETIEDWAGKHCPQILDEEGHVLALPPEEPPEDAEAAEPPVTRTDIWPPPGSRTHRGERAAAGQSPRRRDMFDESRWNFEEDNAICRALAWRVPLIVLIIVMQFTAMLLAAQEDLWTFTSVKENPSLGWSTRTLRRLGAISAYHVAERGEWWRFFTAPLHFAGMMQLAANLSGYLVMGLKLEDEYGILRIFPVYFISSLHSGLATTIFVADRVVVASSSFFFGLLGATCADSLANWNSVALHNRTTAVLLCLFTIAQVLLGFMPLMDNLGNIGAFCGGFLTGLVLLVPPQPVEGRTDPWPEIQMLSGATIVFSLVGGFANLKLGWSEYPDWGKHFSCIETEWWDCEYTFAWPTSDAGPDESQSMQRYTYPPSMFNYDNIGPSSYYHDFGGGD